MKKEILFYIDDFKLANKINEYLNHYPSNSMLISILYLDDILCNLKNVHLYSHIEDINDLVFDFTLVLSKNKDCLTSIKSKKFIYDIVKHNDQLIVVGANESDLLNKHQNFVVPYGLSIVLAKFLSLIKEHYHLEKAHVLALDQDNEEILLINEFSNYEEKIRNGLEKIMHNDKMEFNVTAMKKDSYYSKLYVHCTFEELVNINQIQEILAKSDYFDIKLNNNYKTVRYSRLRGDKDCGFALQMIFEYDNNYIFIDNCFAILNKYIEYHQ